MGSAADLAGAATVLRVYPTAFFLLTVSIGVVRRPHAKNSKKMTTTAW